MAFPKADPKLAALMEKALAKHQITYRPMFGCPAWFAGGNMFAGVFGKAINLRLPPGPEQEALIQAYAGAKIFEPWPGRRMREYVSLPGGKVKAGDKLDGWIKKSFDYAAGLPPKKKKERLGRPSPRRPPPKSAGRTRRRPPSGLQPCQGTRRAANMGPPPRRGDTWAKSPAASPGSTGATSTPTTPPFWFYAAALKPCRPWPSPCGSSGPGPTC